jgi:hypothetical protein
MKTSTAKSSLPAPFCSHANVSKAVGGSENWGDGNACVADWCRDCGSIGIRMTTEERPDAWLRPGYYQGIEKSESGMRLVASLFERLVPEASSMGAKVLSAALSRASAAAHAEAIFLAGNAVPDPPQEQDPEVDELLRHFFGLGSGTVGDGIIEYLRSSDCSPRTRQRVWEECERLDAINQEQYESRLNKSYYCPDHKYNPPENSGMAFCPQCEFPSENTEIANP